MADLLALAKVAGLDELEYVRGAIAGFSCRPDLTAKELHIGRLARLLDHAGLAHCIHAMLDTLDTLREIQRLDGGYLLATPIRCVELTHELQMLITVHSTEELNRHFASVARAGSARLIAGHDSAPLIRQPLLAWMGGDGRTAATWTQFQVLGAKSKLTPSVYDEAIQAFSLKSNRGAKASVLPSWVPLMSEDQLSWQGVSLFRSPIAAKRYRYFFGRAGAKRTLQEGPAVQEHQRIRFGLAALAETPLSIQLTRQSIRTVFRLPLPPPRAERRLLVALCRQEDQANSYTWSCPTADIWPIVKDGLSNLGCEFVEHD